MHGLRRGDRRARVCGCVTHMKTDDGSGADVRSQPPRDGKFMRSASAEKWGGGRPRAPAGPGWVRPPWSMVRRVHTRAAPRRGPPRACSA